MLVSLQIQGGPHELASVLAAIGGISLPVEAPAAPVALPAATETKQPRKAAAKQSVTAATSEPELAAATAAIEQVVDPAPSEPQVQADPQLAEASHNTEEPKAERLSLEKIRAVFNDKLAGHRDTIKGILTSYDSKGLTEFYGKATPEQHAEFFNKISAL